MQSVIIYVTLVVYTLLLLVTGITGAGKRDDWENAKSLYDFKAMDIDGNEVSFDKYKGKVLLVVNVASDCGLTDTNYRQLVDLYGKYQAKGLRIVAFPSNDFMGQESGTEQEIKQFVEKYGVRFDMMSKVGVNGPDAHPLYKWLKSKQGGYLGFDGIKWNFTKFLVDRNGIPIRRYAPTTKPADIESDIKSILYKEL